MGAFGIGGWFGSCGQVGKGSLEGARYGSVGWHGGFDGLGSGFWGRGTMIGGFFFAGWEFGW